MPNSIFNLINPEIYVITAADGEQASGQVATWVTLAGLVPEYLRVTVIISPRNFTFSLIQNSKQFVINLLADHQQEWLPLFGLHSTRDIDKFAGIPIQLTPSGIPILPETCGWAECQIFQEIDVGDRVIYVADILNHQVHENRKPLCRCEALAALPPEVTQALIQKRLLDIEGDRPLREKFESLRFPTS
jgi:flavin reductase (DIM6/NTAB) family NADH-FMN oxidoreductase RutF